MATDARRIAFAWLATLLAAAGARAADFAVPLDGVGVEPLVIDAQVLAALPRQAVDVTDHGKPAHFEGVWLRDVLLRAGAPLGRRLHGRNHALVVLVSARDGYAVSFALAEFEPSYRDKPVLLADRRDGAPLFGETGPLQVVVADEGRAGRWIRQVARIELIDPAGPASAGTQAHLHEAFDRGD